jgi:hypothetical protein
MAETKDIVEIRNETPLDILVRDVAIRLNRFLTPLEVADYEPGPVASYGEGWPGRLTFYVHPMGLSGYFCFERNSLPRIVTIDVANLARVLGPENRIQQFCNELPALKERGSNDLRVTNETNQVADVYLLDLKGDRLMGRIAPGGTWEHPAQPLMLWHFRTPSGLTLGIWFHPTARMEPDRKPPFQVKLTEGFLDAWQAYQRRPQSAKGTRVQGPLRLIGEKRASTPGQDDPLFVSASTVRLDFSEEPFNGLENREVRDVEIAGPLLRWSKSNRILSGYYGETNAADIRSLTIYCDRMEVNDNLQFPRTNVTIYARELVFTGNGQIDTTPLPYPGRAQSMYLTEHSDVPADANGEPTYQAADGRKGEPGGKITVHAREVRYVEDPGNQAPWLRFFCCGGKGQQGEAGGLKAYERGEGQPEKYGPLPAVTADQVARAFKEAFNLDCWHFSWPGMVDGPSKIPSDPWKNLNVVEVSVFAYSASWWLRYLHLPSHTHSSEPNSSSSPKVSAVAAPKRCNPRQAYPGGWPGDGGDGGIFTLVSEKPEEWFGPIRDPGEQGDPTLPVMWDYPDKNIPVHLWLVIWDKEVGQQRVPEMGWMGENLQVGQGVDGRAGHPPAHERNKYLVWDNAYIVDRESRAYMTRPNQGRRGNAERVVRSDLSWAQPAAMAAVLSYARTAFRNGFRKEAARALAPYYAVAVLQAEVVAKCSPEVQMAFGSIVALYNNLALNVDYYGNPPGWVPRLNALSNLGVLKSVREAAYGTFYFADKMLREAEALEDLRETAVQATDALEAEMKAAKDKLQKAYDELPKAMGKLNQAQKQVVGVEEDIVNLRREAIGRSVDKAMLQRFVSAALQLVDGVAKSLPVGQPFLGLAGSAFGAAAKIDWTAEKPLETAGAAVAHLSQQVNTFVTEKTEVVASAVTGKLRGEQLASEDLVTKLTREQEDAAQEPAKAAKAVETTWRDFKSEEHQRLEAKIKTTEEAIRKIKEAKTEDSEPDSQTASEFLTALRKQREAINPGAGAVAKTVAPLQKELVEYRKRQFELINTAQKVARIKNAELKALAETPKHLLPPTIEQKLVAATRQSADQTARIARKEATARETMTKLADLGTGLASVGNAIISMATPVTDEDPTVQRLADELLVSDPVLRAAGQRLAKKLQELMAEKKQAAAELLRWQQQATTSLGTVTRNLATMSQLSRQRQSLDMGLDPVAKAYLKETRDAAKDALGESIYWFVKSNQYEQLEDVEDSFFNSDSWASELQNQENTKLKTEAPPAEARTGQGAVVTRARRILLSKEAFDKIGDQVFKGEQLRLGTMLLEKRQSRAPKPDGEYVGCVLQRTAQPKDDWERRQNEMLDALEKGEVAFDFVRDFRKGSYDWNDARVVQVKLVKLDIEASDPNLSLTFRVQQRGEMVIADQVGDERRFYLFRPGRYDDPIGWTFTYNHWERRTNSGITVPPVKDPLGDAVKAMLDASLTFQDYQPALFSDYMIRITDLKGYDGARKGLTSIRGLTMNVYLSGR